MTPPPTRSVPPPSAPDGDEVVPHRHRTPPRPALAGAAHPRVDGSDALRPPPSSHPLPSGVYRRQYWMQAAAPASTALTIGSRPSTTAGRHPLPRPPAARSSRPTLHLQRLRAL
uniref:Uncharacterized protein n=1 Tax=Oryza rufipogon TaxID=4529 RepID=A0A0E0RGL0_ORYRU